MTPYDLTTEDFKSYFYKGEFVYSSIWDNETVYNSGDIVFYKGDNWKSLIEDNVNNQPSFVNEDIWELLNNSLHVMDEDIEKAFLQASGNFNKKLFANDEDVGKMAFLMLTAHYIIQDYNMLTGNSQVGIMTSKGVGGVSASYGIPEAYLKNPLYNYLSNTPYGLKYLSYICNRSIGNVFIVKGKTNFR
jgi:hypothetical protein